jgi:hypothetical protein
MFYSLGSSQSSASETVHADLTNFLVAVQGIRPIKRVVAEMDIDIFIWLTFDLRKRLTRKSKRHPAKARAENHLNSSATRSVFIQHTELCLTVGLHLLPLPYRDQLSPSRGYHLDSIGRTSCNA